MISLESFHQDDWLKIAEEAMLMAMHHQADEWIPAGTHSRRRRLGMLLMKEAERQPAGTDS